MKLTRIALSFCCLSALSFLFVSPAFAAAPAYVDNQVREGVRRGGTQRVIIQMGDTSRPEIWSPAWKQRVSAIRSLTKRVVSSVPKLHVRRTFDLYPFVAATVDETTLDQVARQPEVEAVFPDRRMKGYLNYTGPLVGQPQAETAGYTGAGVGVAVIDTGVDYQHPAFNTSTAKFFSDVKPGNWAWTKIEALAEHAIAGGNTDGTYAPAGTVTRDQMAVFIARAVSDPSQRPDLPGYTPPTTPSFPDVPTTYWAYKYIEFCKAQGIVQGDATGYHPTDLVDRGHMAVFLARAIADPSERPDLPDYTPPATASFPDVATDAWNYKYVEYIKSQSVTSGYADGDYHPEYPCTRDQMAVFIGRAFNVVWGGRVIGGVNLLANAADPQDPMDDFFHGTMVSGVIASMDTTYRGIAPGGEHHRREGAGQPRQWLFLRRDRGHPMVHPESEHLWD